jgi:hypothetical protein
MGRDRRNGRANLKTRVGIATAVLVGGGAIGVAAVAATSHGATPTASAGYSRSYNTPWTQLNSAMDNWAWNRNSSYHTLASMWQQRTYNQYWQHNRMLAVQRGIVFLATKRFIILQSANGSLHLWLTSGNTKFANVSNSTSGTGAMTGNTGATWQAMQGNNIIPATDIMAGSVQTATQMLTPSTVPDTIKVVVAGTDLTVTVTITRNTAAVSSTASTPWNGNPWWQPTTNWQNPWAMVAPRVHLARGDLALIAGFRSHNLLHAQIVLFTPLNTGMIGGGTGTGATQVPTTPNTVPGGTSTSSAGSSGTHF